MITGSLEGPGDLCGLASSLSFNAQRALALLVCSHSRVTPAWPHLEPVPPAVEGQGWGGPSVLDAAIITLMITMMCPPVMRIGR